MSREWKPGDVAIIAIAGRGDVVAMYMDGDDWETPYAEADGQTTYKARRVSVIRPLVVIDPEDEEHVNRVANAITGTHSHVGVRTGLDWINVQAALRSLVTPPKPDEPQNRYAAVIDRNDEEWLRGRDGRWWQVKYAGLVPQATSKSWSDISAVKVLSEGVS